jgi:hypothetical protein
MQNRLWIVAAVAVLSLAGATVAIAASGRQATAKTTTTSTAPVPTPRNGETPLTGDVATKAKAAAVAKVGAGSTADFASTETDSSLAGAAYEVHVTKADGSHVEVILDQEYAVLAVETAPAGGPGFGHGGHH